VRDLRPYWAGTSPDIVESGTVVTTDLIERIQSELATSLGDAHRASSVGLHRGWGNILYVTARLRRCPCHDRDELRARFNWVAARVLAGERHVVEIDWGGDNRRPHSTAFAMDRTMVERVRGEEWEQCRKPNGRLL
jgi:hypothetical protein